MGRGASTEPWVPGGLFGVGQGTGRSEGIGRADGLDGREVCSGLPGVAGLSGERAADSGQGLDERRDAASTLAGAVRAGMAS